jgi:hypothetical protein
VSKGHLKILIKFSVELLFFGSKLFISVNYVDLQKGKERKSFFIKENNHQKLHIL